MSPLADPLVRRFSDSQVFTPGKLPRTPDAPDAPDAPDDPTPPHAVHGFRGAG